MSTDYPQAAWPAPARYRRRGGGPGAFLLGFLIGFVPGALFLLVVLASALLFFPPGRTNILLLGLDRRPQEKTFVVRTDTMILMTINPAGRYVGMLSIPRDLYVTLPDGSVDRINTAHVYAELDTPGSGPAAAMQTVRSNFGVDVHHYVRLDLAGFVRILDAMGGIDLDVPDPLVDYEYPTYDYGVETVAFEAGPQHLDGERALAYARIRHGSSDFQRAERQQRVIQAIFARLLNPAAWPRLPLLAAAVSQSVDSDLTAVELARLAPTLLLVGPRKIDSRVIEGRLVDPYTTDGGASVLLPVWANINPVLLEMFGQ